MIRYGIVRPFAVGAKRQPPEMRSIGIDIRVIEGFTRDHPVEPHRVRVRLP